tara:strand:- start:22 stop:168 length:147 start_codon:yes stop_codon:yes gene_type:complete
MKKQYKTKKKTYQGNGKYTKTPNKGSASIAGGKTSKKYKKKYRGQGKR